MLIRTAALGVCAAVSAAHGQLTLDLAFNPLDRGAFVAVAYSSASDEIYAYAEFGGAIDVYSRTGVFLRSIPRPGPSSNDIDLEFADAPLTVGNVSVPAGTLLVMNSENSGDERLYAVTPSGTVLSSVVMNVAGQAVGLTYHPLSQKVFVVDWASDVVRECSAVSGAQLQQFPVAPAGSPAYDVFYGDIDSLRATGSLYLVSSSHNVVRELGLSGNFVRDISLTALGITSMSGLAFDDRRGEAWVTTLSGTIYRIGGFPGSQGGCPADWNGDDSVDGDDVITFLNQWDAGNGDFNLDGGTDGDDVIAFFSHWDNAC